MVHKSAGIITLESGVIHFRSKISQNHLMLTVRVLAERFDSDPQL